MKKKTHILPLKSEGIYSRSQQIVKKRKKKEKHVLKVGLSIKVFVTALENRHHPMYPFILSWDTAWTLETLEVRRFLSLCRRGGGIFFLIFLLLRVWYDSKLTRSMIFFFFSLFLPVLYTFFPDMCLNTHSLLTFFITMTFNAVCHGPGSQLHISGSLRMTVIPLKDERS